MNKRETLLVLGAHSKVGQEIAYEFSKKGYNVILALRNIDRLAKFAEKIKNKFSNEVFLEEFDILDTKSFNKFLENLPLSPKIIICTIGLMNKNEQSTNYSIEDLVNTNFLKLIIFLEAASKYLITINSQSTIIVFGSVAGIRGRKKNYIYGASKAGLHCYLSGLRQRYTKNNLNVLTVIPGYIESNMLDNKKSNYLDILLISKPQKVAKIIYKAYKSKKLVVYTPFWRLIMFIINIIPESLFKKLSF